MIHLHRHRVIDEIEKKREYGHNLVFLTGDAINERDKFFYDLVLGIQTLPETLQSYYSTGAAAHDFFVHIHNATEQVKCFQNNGQGFEEVKIQVLLAPPKRKSSLKKKDRNQEEKKNEEAENAASGADEAAGGDFARLNEAIRHISSRIVVFLENLELVARLHDTQPDMTVLASLREWPCKSNVLVIATISDMELLTKYSFADNSIFVGNPDAHEIYYAWWRHLARNGHGAECAADTLDEIAHSLGASKKTLNACMRILKKRLGALPEKIEIADFKDSFEKGIEEKIAWEDVCLAPDIKKRIESAIDSFIDKSLEVEENGEGSKKGLLLAGPPGTGKTLIAKSLANEKNCYFMAPTLADLKGEYVGQSSVKIKRIFAEARANEPTILFIDEADTVFPARGGSMMDSFGLDMVNQFLQEIDGAKTGKQKIFVIAATNRPQAMDEAIKSRLDKPIEVPLPDWEIRSQIFDANIRKFQPNQPLSVKGTRFEELVKTRSERMSGRDIANFIKNLYGNARIPLADDEATEKRIAATFKLQADNLFNELQAVLSSENMIRPEDNKRRFKDIIGLEGAKEKMGRQARYIADGVVKREYEKFGIDPGKGILLYGPPGNGKSHLAEALAGEYGFHFFKVLSKDFAANTSKSQLENLDKIFSMTFRFSKMLDENKGVVLFFDEVDSLASRQVLDPVVRGTLLNYLADPNTLRDRNSKIIFMAATNYMEKLDEAMTRRGRIDEPICLDNPGEAEGIEILVQLADKQRKNVEKIERSVLCSAWNKLRDEKRRRIDARVASSNQTDQLEAIKLLNNPSASNPSASDLKDLFRSLKEIAFNTQSFAADGQLLKIDAKVVGCRFGKNGGR